VSERRQRSDNPLRRALAWGLIWAVIGAVVLYLFAPNPWALQPSRATDLRASLAVLDHGGPALLGFRPKTHAPYAIGYSDDQGIYVVVPVLAHELGAANPIVVLRWLWIAAWAFTLLFSGAMFRALFRSDWATLVAPPALLVFVLSFGTGDIYWVAPWVIVTFMPALILLARERPRSLGLALVAIALVAGVVSTIRSDAGLAVALAAAVVAVMAGAHQPLHQPLRRALVLVVAFAYVAPTAIVLPAIRAHRDDRAHVDLSAHEPTSHPLWHSLYIGLGYTSNRYGIHYGDGYAGAAAQEADPGVPYLSHAYASALHKQVSALLDHDRGFVVKMESEKAVVELFIAGPYLLLLALLLPTALTARGPARLRRSEILLFLPALAIGVLPAIVAVPFRDYSLTLLGPLAALSLLAIGSVAARAEAEWRATASADGTSAHVRLLTRGMVSNGSGRRTVRTLLVTLVVLVPVSGLARHFEAEHNRWDRLERNPPTVVLATAPARATASRS
jgi:hypothetical protein